MAGWRGAGPEKRPWVVPTSARRVLPGLRGCRGRAGVPKQPAAPGTVSADMAPWPFPGELPVADERLGQAQYGVGDDDQLGPAVGLLRVKWPKDY